MLLLRCQDFQARALARALAVVVLTSVAGCSNSPAAPSGAGSEAGQPAPPLVATVKPERHTVRRVVEQPGYVEAFEQTPVYTKIAGYVQKVHVDIGDLVQGPVYDSRDPTKKVKEGQRLADLWVPEMVEEVNQKKAQVERAAEEIKQAEEMVNVAEANLHSAEARVKEAEAGRTRAQAEYDRWRVELQRSEDLVRRKLLDEQTRDVARYQSEAARAGREEVEAKVQSARAMVKEQEAQVRKARADVRVVQARHLAAQADLQYVTALLEYARVEAPFTGRVTRRNVNTGDFLQPAAGTGSKGEPLFVVARVDKVRVFVEVPETDATLVNKGARARLRFRAFPGAEFTGAVARSTWSLDPKSRTLRAEIDVDNAEGRLRPGMYASAAITIEHKDAWTLPVSAIVLTGNQPYGYRVEQGKAVRTPVQLGIRDGQRIEVLARQVRAAEDENRWEPFTGNEVMVGADPGALKDEEPVRTK
jgi:HlyD family secretion protein